VNKTVKVKLKKKEPVKKEKEISFYFQKFKNLIISLKIINEVIKFNFLKKYSFF